MRKHKKQRIVKKAAFALAVLFLIVAMLYSGLRILESTVFTLRQEEVQPPSKTITRDGVDYFPRQDITTLLVMGIDQYGPVEDSGSYLNPGAADMVMVLVFDEVKETCTILQLNRDTMVEMPVLGLGGRQAGTAYGQLALSHTYGSGLEDSCENTGKTVSDFLGGIRIDYYLAMNMDAIAILNDAVGGVTVNVTDDFSLVDATIPRGRVTLMGEQAINYVRTRKDVGDQLNLSRLKRQEEYMDSFLAAFRATEPDEAFLTSVYEAVDPYVVTDCSVTVLTGMVSRCGSYALTGVLAPPGENVMGEEYFEFYADQEQLDRIVLELFYAPKG